MPTMDNHPASNRPEPGLISGIAGIVKNGISLLITRIQLAATEASALGANVVKLIVIGVLAAFGAWFAIAYWSVLIVALAWETMGAWILFIMALLFTAMVVGLLLYARGMVRDGKLSMQATMTELRGDRDALL